VFVVLFEYHTKDVVINFKCAQFQLNYSHWFINVYNKTTPFNLY